MRILTTLLLCSLLLLNSGCTRSLHPLLKKSDLIFEEALIGVWKQEGDIWSFSKKKENVYELVVHETRKDRYSYLEARLGKLEDQLFLEFSLDQDKNSINSEFASLHLLPVYTFAHVKQIEPTLQFSWPDPSWVEYRLKKSPKETIKHEMIEDSFVLTASTEDLQKFFLQHLEAKGLFDNYSNLKKEEL